MKWIFLIVVALISLGQTMTAKPVFAQGTCEELEKLYVSPSDLQGFTFAETRATGHYEFLDPGLRMWTEGATTTDKVAGYTPVSMLLSEVETWEMDYTITSGGDPGGQIRVDIDNDGVFSQTVDATLVFEDDYQEVGEDPQWWSFYDFGVGGGSGYPTMASLAEIAAAHPTLMVLSTGFSLGSGVLGDGVLSSITLNCTQWIFDLNPPPQVIECESYSQVRVTPINMHGINFSETRTKGHYEFQSGGLHIWTEDTSSQSKVAGYIPVDYPLWQVGDFDLNYTVIAGTTPPGGQLVIDKDDDSDPDGILVYEPDFYPAGYWWSFANFGVEGTPDYATFATLDRILEVNPNAQVMAIGFSLGSGVFGEGVITTLTAGCTVYTFGLEQVNSQEPNVDEIDSCNEYGSVTLPTVTGLTYTATPENATTGNVTVTVDALPGYEVVGETQWEYDLGEYYTCPALFIQPVVVEIDQCNEFGGVYFYNNPGVDYFATPPNAIEGRVEYSATAQAGFHLVNYPGIQEVDLGEYEPCPPTVVTETVVVTNTETITHVEIVTDTITVTDTIVVTDTELVTDTIIVTDTIVVTDTQVITENLYTPGWPVFIEPTCALPVAQIYIPGPVEIAYVTEGDAGPGATVIVRAHLRPEVSGRLVGQTEWVHTFRTLNCTPNFDTHMYLPKLDR